MTGAQRSSIVAGIWLVALGGVFLVQQALDLSWGEAWPLFIIAAGIGTGASTLVALLGRPFAPWTALWALIWPVIMIGVGALLFVDLAGLADIDAFGLLAQWWPVALIAIGLIVLLGAVWPGGRAVEDRLEIPVGTATSGEVIVKFGAGVLELGAGTPGRLVEGSFEGGVRRRDLGPGRVELEADVVQIFPLGDRLHWKVGLAPDLPLTLRVEGGASRGELDLSGLQVTNLQLQTGASSTRIVLPATVERCHARIEAGAAQVRLEVPRGVAARIRSQMGLGSTTVDESRFPRDGSGWASPDYGTAACQVEIDIQGGVGSVRVS